MGDVIEAELSVVLHLDGRNNTLDGMLQGYHG